MIHHYNCLLFIGVGASKFFGVRRIFAQKVVQFLPKKLCNFCQPFFGVTTKKWSSPIFLHTLGAIFAQIFRDFAKISRDFARIFNKSKLLGVRLHTRLLHHCFCSS